MFRYDWKGRILKIQFGPNEDDMTTEYYTLKELRKNEWDLGQNLFNTDIVRIRNKCKKFDIERDKIDEKR